MAEEYLLVKTNALPEVFRSVARAKHLLSTGEASSATEAARMVGISRSAFYKYKDEVMPYVRSEAASVITVHAVLKDQPGALAQFTAVFFDVQANILTVNQNIPVQSAASVSVSARTDTMSVSLSELLERLRALPQVQSLDNISGGI